MTILLTVVIRVIRMVGFLYWHLYVKHVIPKSAPPIS